MASSKGAADTCNIPSSIEAGFIGTENNAIHMEKRFRADFEVIKDEDGFLCAADKKQMIFTDGKNKEELEKNIKDAVECYFEVPYTEVDIRINYK
jgi:predicted RNase H-like HicB family nuclease